MVDFSLVIPFYWVIPLGLSVILIASLYGWAKRSIKKLVRTLRRVFGYQEGIPVFDGTMEADAEEKRKEGIFWYVGEGFRYLDLFLVLYAGLLIWEFISTPVPTVSLFDEILGDHGLVLPVVSLGLAHFLVKMIPYAMGLTKEKKEVT